MMKATKKTAVKEAVKTEAVKVESAVKSAAQKAEPVVKAAVEKAEPVVKAAVEKAEPIVKAAAQKAAPAVKKAGEAKKTIKETAKKATAKKAPAKKEEAAVKVSVQFDGKTYTTEDLVKIAKDVWKYDLKKEKEFKSVEIYVKPEESAAYYVIDGEVNGKFAL